jgi:intracellular multiplication protein IcmV
MAFKDIFKFSRKTFFNPSGWLGANELSAYTQIIGDTLKTTFTPDKSSRVETFEQALQRLQITETDLQERMKQYRAYTFIFLALGAAAFMTGFYYLFAYGTFSAWMLAMVVALLFAANAFRFDFWCLQIKNRKLGCTLQEWWADRFGTSKGPTA